MNQNYKILLFDADDTLLDFHTSEYDALSSLFSLLAVPLLDTMRTRYHDINLGLWKQFERGEISKEQILDTRFRVFFSELSEQGLLPEHLKIKGNSIDISEIQTLYQNELAKGSKLISGATKVLNHLKDSHDLYIVSNGVATTQYSRLKASGLYPYFKDVFISEVTGYQKPQVEFFYYCIKRIPNYDPSRTLIIGDSLTSDILGGNNINIHTCWYNPSHKTNNTNAIATYEISDLESLLSII